MRSAYLAAEGFDKTMGARPLRRAVQRLIEDPLAEDMLRGVFRVGDTIRAEMDGQTITFRRADLISKSLEEGIPVDMTPSDDTGLPLLDEPAALS